MKTAQLAKTQVLPASQLKTDPANLRRHPVRNLEAIKASLKRFGFQKPIVIDANDVVIAGNGTLKAALELGIKQVPCVRSLLTGAERVAYAIADNRAAELAEWDNAALLETLQAMNPDDIDALGFDGSDMTDLIDEQQAELDDDTNLAPAPVAVTQLGDIWHLGDHRIINGDSTKTDTYAALLQGELAALCSTDPPYLVDYTGKRLGKKADGSSGDKDWSALYIEVPSGSAMDFYTKLWSCILEFTQPNSALYCWHSHTRSKELSASWEQLDILCHQVIIWAKPAPVFTRTTWLYGHEPAFMGWKRGHKPTNKAVATSSSVWKIGKSIEQHTHEDLVAMIKEQSDLWEIDWEGKARVVGNEHPTQKPLEIFARPMRKHTNVGDIVLEPFSGSGSQLIAAEMCQRRCRAIELQPVFVDVAIRRWQRLTGKDATLADGTPWRTVAKQRGIRLDEDGTPIGVQPPKAAQEPKPKPTRRKAKAGEV